MEHPLPDSGHRSVRRGERRAPLPAWQQFIKETLPALGCVGARDAMGEFEHGNDRNSNPFVAGFQHNGFQDLPGILAPAFGGDDGRGIASVPSGRLQRLAVGGNSRFDVLREVGIDSRC